MHTYARIFVCDTHNQVGELEQSLSSREADYDRATEEVQNLEDEVATLRDEMALKEHRISELEQLYVTEKSRVVSLETEVQQLLDKLALETEKTTRLSYELQEGHVEKDMYVTLVDENSVLQGKLQEVESELQSQLRLQKKQMEETEAAMTQLLKCQATDETTIQELRGANTVAEAKLASLREEEEESRKEMQKASLKIDQLVMKQ